MKNDKSATDTVHGLVKGYYKENKDKIHNYLFIAGMIYLGLQVVIATIKVISVSI